MENNINEEISKHISKTGTLTVGLVCKDGILIAADKRVTYAGHGGGVSYIAGTMKKVNYVNERIITTMAGTASDAKKVLSILKAELKLKELRTKSQSSIGEAASLLANMTFQNIRTPSMIPSIAHFLVGGYDSDGICLYDVMPDGHIQKIEDYVATGSGIMQAHPVLDSEYRKGISSEEGVKLIIKAIKAATAREPGVGAGMDIYLIKKNEIKEILSQEFVQELKNSN